MSILTLDLASQTGWAFESMGLVSSGTIGFKLKKTDGKGVRFYKFRSWLRDQIETYKPKVVVFEEVMRWSSGDAAKCYCGLLAITQMECESKEIPYKGIHVGTIKKHATGKGNASKEQMIAAARYLYPKQKIEDDNQADALAILHTAKHLYG